MSSSAAYHICLVCDPAGCLSGSDSVFPWFQLSVVNLNDYQKLKNFKEVSIIVVSWEATAVY